MVKVEMYDFANHKKIIKLFNTGKDVVTFMEDRYNWKHFVILKQEVVKNERRN